MPSKNISDHICGCHYVVPSSKSNNLKRNYLPQVKLDSHTTINPLCFTTKLVQTYHNPSKDIIKEVRYTFPLYDGVAVNGYTITYADKVLSGVVKQTEVAKQTYDAAVERGKSAGLLEALPAGIFGVTLGNVPPETDIVVNITYCGELKHDAAIDGLRYMLPTSIAPRYGSYPGELLNSNAVPKGGISITVDADMGSSAIRKVQSPSHPIAVSMGATSTTVNAADSAFTPQKASATLTLGSAELANDFVLQLLIDDIGKPRAIIERHPTLLGQRAIMATLVPKFALQPAHPEIVFIADQSGSMRGSKNDELVKALRVFLKSLPMGTRFNVCAFGNSFKFLWPRSQAYSESNVKVALSFVGSFTASYGGTEILKPIKAAFEQKLKDLPMEVMLLTDGEIWAEDAVFSFINQQIRDKKVDARVFALGIGGDVSHTLVEGIARAGNGLAQFVTQHEETDQKVMRMLKAALYPHTTDYQLEVHYRDDASEQSSAVATPEASDDEDEYELVERVNDCLVIADEEPPPYDEKKATGFDNNRAPKTFYAEQVDLDTSAHADDKIDTDRYAHLPAIDTPKILQAPAEIPPLFPFSRTTVYLLLSPTSEQQKKVSSVTLRAKSPQGPLELTIPVEALEAVSVPTVHQLAARKAIQDLEEGRGWLQSATTGPESVPIKDKYESRFDELVEREAVRLGERFQVAGKYTSFVAVQEGGAELPETQQSAHVPKLQGQGHAAVKVGNVQLASAVQSARTSSSGFSGMRRAPTSGTSRGIPARQSSASSSGSSFFGGMASAFRGTSPPVRGASGSGGGLFSSSPAPSFSGMGAGMGAGMGSRSSGRSSYQAPRPSMPRASPSTGASCSSSSSFAGMGSGRFGQSSYHAPRSPMPGASPSRGASFSSSPRSTGMGSGLFGQSSSYAPPPPMYGASASPSASFSRSSGFPGVGSGLPGRSSSPAPRSPAPAPRSPAPRRALASRAARSSHFSIDKVDAVGTSASPYGAGAFSHQRPQPIARGASVLTPNAGEHLREQHDIGEEIQKALLHSNAQGKDTVQAMHRLISMQRFSGEWEWSEDLLRTLDLNPTELQASSFNVRLSTDANATLLVIAFLEVRVHQKRDVWELIVAKATAWLKQAVGMNDQEVETMIKQAETVLLKYGTD